MKVIYVIGKYTDKELTKKIKNIDHAVKKGLEIALLGNCVIVPHTNFKWHEGVIGYERVMEQCYELIKRSDAVYICNNWKSSKGSRREISLAKQLKKEMIWEEEPN